ncbi:hypothetical protein [Pseudonocardia sp. ICBG1293]|uniref:hypothetical protein n=1 Tax=Pseudonocardia sp. ICBG1293 TaxID=2844382 RepID=UPI001CCEFA7C|nr:hypothetical protein [Pseudonocardia sp. ICBG1293]
MSPRRRALLVVVALLVAVGVAVAVVTALPGTSPGSARPSPRTGPVRSCSSPATAATAPAWRSSPGRCAPRAATRAS